MTASASRSGADISLTLRPTAGTPAQVPEGLHFFASDGLIAYDVAQSTKAEHANMKHTVQATIAARPTRDRSRAEFP